MEEGEEFQADVPLSLGVKPDFDSTSILEFRNQNKEMLKFMPNGDVFVYGRLATNDMDIVEGIKAFLKDSGYMKPLVDINPVEEGPQDI
jgi:hypothetical protein